MPVTCVTGANGFLAAWILDALQRRGHDTRGTVRNRRKPGPGAGVTLFEADLLAPGSFAPAFDGCRTVIHCASPYKLNVQDPQRELVEPALEGTRNVLATCARTPTVRRVVLTSSMAAVTDEPDSARILTEDDWNRKSTLQRNPYYFSKTLAERAAWDFMAAERPAFDLVVLNPFMVIGPSFTPDLNTSNKVLADLLNGVYPAIVSLTWGFVDVRDVAEAHVRAVETEGAQGRYLCAADAVPMRDVIGWMRESGYGGPPYRLPRFSLANPAGNWIAKLASYAQPRDVGTYLRTHLGRVPRYDTSKIRRDLGLDYRPVRETVGETLQDLEKWGHIARRSGAAA